MLNVCSLVEWVIDPESKCLHHCWSIFDRIQFVSLLQRLIPVYHYTQASGATVRPRLGPDNKKSLVCLTSVDTQTAVEYCKSDARGSQCAIHEGRGGEGRCTAMSHDDQLICHQSCIIDSSTRLTERGLASQYVHALPSTPLLFSISLPRRQPCSLRIDPVVSDCSVVSIISTHVVVLVAADIDSVVSAAMP